MGVSTLLATLSVLPYERSDADQDAMAAEQEKERLLKMANILGFTVVGAPAGWLGLGAHRVRRRGLCYFGRTGVLQIRLCRSTTPTRSSWARPVPGKRRAGRLLLALGRHAAAPVVPGCVRSAARRSCPRRARPAPAGPQAQRLQEHPVQGPAAGLAGHLQHAGAGAARGAPRRAAMPVHGLLARCAGRTPPCGPGGAWRPCTPQHRAPLAALCARLTHTSPPPWGFLPDRCARCTSC
jgi:hypothetical protein